jgi:phenylpyruvate tautomerase PptA (4-oxalocrotonate tautomerase family)
MELPLRLTARRNNPALVYGAPADSVHVWFQEVSREDYASNGKLVADT